MVTMGLVACVDCEGLPEPLRHQTCDNHAKHRILVWQGIPTSEGTARSLLIRLVELRVVELGGLE